MHGAIHRQFIMGLLGTFLGGTAANAAVSLFYNSSTTPVTINAPAGTTFSVPVKLTSTDAAADKVNGLSYQVISKLNGTNVNGIFSFVSRTIPNTSPFQFSNVASQPQATLNPSNNTDLGAAENDTSASVAASTYDVATVTFMVIGNAPANTYTLSFSNASFGRPYPDTSSPSFTTLGTLNVFVPEPATALCGSLFCGLTLMRRRRV